LQRWTIYGQSRFHVTFSFIFLTWSLLIFGDLVWNQLKPPLISQPMRGFRSMIRAPEWSGPMRVALHLEAGPIRCVWGLNPHLWLAKRFKLVPTPLHVKDGLIWWYGFFNWTMYVMTWPELVKLGAPKMEGQCHISF